MFEWLGGWGGLCVCLRVEGLIGMINKMVMNAESKGVGDTLVAHDGVSESYSQLIMIRRW